MKEMTVNAALKNNSCVAMNAHYQIYKKINQKGYAGISWVVDCVVINIQFN